MYNELGCVLERLSTLASDIYGEELIADMCSGQEIEFRHPGEEMGGVVRLEDLLLIIDRARKEDK